MGTRYLVTVVEESDDGMQTSERQAYLEEALSAMGVSPSTCAEEIVRIAWRLDELERKQLLDHRTMHATFNEHQARLDGWERTLNERVTQLEERLAVLEEDHTMPGMTPAQYVALRSDWK